MIRRAVVFVHDAGVSLQGSIYFYSRERHGTIKWLERGALPMSLPVVRFRTTWCRIFNLGTLFQCCVLGQGTSPSKASIDSGENEVLVGQRWQGVRYVKAPKWSLCSRWS